MNPASNPFLSVVIPTFERPDDLKKCLESLSYQNQIGAPSFEIIVSDDSESSDSIILVEKEFPKVVFTSKKFSGITSSVFLKHLNHQNSVGDIYTNKWHTRRYFNVSKWINNASKNSKNKK